MDAGAITALVLAIAGMLAAMGKLLLDARRKRDSERPGPLPPQRPPLQSVDPAGETGPYPAVGYQGHLPAPGLPPALATTLERLEGVIAGLSGYARAEDIQRLQTAFDTLSQALENYRLDFEQLARSHESTRRALLALQESGREQSEQLGRLARQIEDLSRRI